MLSSPDRDQAASPPGSSATLLCRAKVIIIIVNTMLFIITESSLAFGQLDLGGFSDNFALLCASGAQLGREVTFPDLHTHTTALYD